MHRLTHRAFILLVCMTAFCGWLHAQTGKTITLRMLDGKTGKLIETSNFLVRIDHEPAVHADWVVQNVDGTGKLTLPRNASVLSIQATYDSAMLIYVNCDTAGGKANPGALWYSVAEILTLGVATPNSCEKPADAAKFKTLAKLKPGAKRTPGDKPALVVNPGEFVFYVRKQNWREQIREDYSVR
jgi:hypothetical protein